MYRSARALCMREKGDSYKDKQHKLAALRACVGMHMREKEYSYMRDRFLYEAARQVWDNETHTLQILPVRADHIALAQEESACKTLCRQPLQHTCRSSHTPNHMKGVHMC